MSEEDKPRKGFRYIQTPHGSLVIAYQFTEDGDKRLFDVGVSFCSPRDQFNRAKGKLIAEGRMLAQRSPHGAGKAFSSRVDEKFEYPNVVAEYAVMSPESGIIGPQWLDDAIGYFKAEQRRLAEERAA